MPVLVSCPVNNNGHLLRYVIGLSLGIPSCLTVQSTSRVLLSRQLVTRYICTLAAFYAPAPLLGNDLYVDRSDKVRPSLNVLVGRGRTALKVSTA
jgi:hypothetical protein